MFRALTGLFQPLRAGKRPPATRRRVPTVRPQVECLGERLLPATGLGPGSSLGTSLWPVGQPPVVRLPYQGPSLVGKSVEITEPIPGYWDPTMWRWVSSIDIGTVTFTQMNAYGDFQGTYESHLGNAPGVPAWLQSTYEYSLDIGPIAVSGHVGNAMYSLGSGGGVSYGLSFSGAGNGMAAESRAYTLVTASGMLGPTQHEFWSIADHQTFSFSGSMSPSGTGLTLNGTATESDTVQWVWDLENLAPNDPNHHTMVEGRLLGVTNITVTGTIL